MFTIAICDDNNEFLNRELSLASSYLDSLSIEYRINTYCSGVELIKTEKISSIDLFLLDYEMDGLTGFETAKVIREKAPNASIAFVTVFYELSREGYKFDAIRYLIKQELTFETELQDCLNKALQLKAKRANNSKLFEFVDKTLRVNPENIVYIQTNKHYLLCYILENSVVTCYKKRDKITNIQAELEDTNSFSVIRSGILVNLKYVNSIDRKGFVNINAGNSFVRIIRLSDSFKSSFISHYMKYLGDK